MALTDAYAEAAAALASGQDIEVSLHTDDPGENGANEASITMTNGRPVIATLDGWDAFVDDVDTNGRAQANAEDAEFGNAPANENVSWFAYWESDGTTFIGGWPLVEPRSLVLGEPVIFPAGSLLTIGAAIE